MMAKIEYNIPMLTTPIIISIACQLIAYMKQYNIMPIVPKNSIIGARNSKKK